MAERFQEPSSEDVMLVHYRVKRTGQWKTEQGSRASMTARAKVIAVDERYDRMDFEIIPAATAAIPAELGGGTVDFTRNECPECGGHPGDCASWCSLARFGR